MGKASVGGLPVEESCPMKYLFCDQAGVGEVLRKKVAFDWCLGGKVKCISSSHRTPIFHLWTRYVPLHPYFENDAGCLLFETVVI